MVIVAMAEYDGVGPREIDAELRSVVLQHHALAGVEEHAVAASVDPVGEAVFAE